MPNSPALTIETATRQGMIPLVGVYGKSGSGKTHSALLIARGLAGPDKEIAVIDTERKRSGALVGLIPGGFKRINLEPPFTPELYRDAIKLLEDENVGAGIVDSMSHEWDGEGGVLEMQEAELNRMAGDNWAKRDACNMTAWKEPKKRHKLLVQHILRCNIPLVCCLRADEKVHMEKVEGKTKVFTDTFSTPIYDKRFIFEMLVNLETVVVNGKPGCARIVKWTHPDLLEWLPKEGEQIDVKHGQAIAQWCLGAGAKVPDIGSLKRELWSLLETVHKGDAAKLEEWLRANGILDPMVRLAECNEPELRSIVGLARKKLKTK